MRASTRLRPALGLPLLAIGFLCLLALSNLLLGGVRLDLTENREYTLTDGTLGLARSLDEPVTLHFFYSEGAAKEYPQIATYAQRVRELLQELAVRSEGKVRFESVDPLPFSEDEDRAAAFGLQGVPLPDGSTFYLGLVGTNSTDGEVPIPFLQPDREAFLEYNIAKVLAALATPDRPVLGWLSSLPTGPGFDPATASPTSGWVVDQQLRELFELRRLEAEVAMIPDDITLLVVVHPKDLSEDTLYAIDQFVLRGGRLLVFVDPEGEADASGDAGGLLATSPTRSSDLAPLFAAWGLEYDPAKVVLDAGQAMTVRTDADDAGQQNLAVLGLDASRMNPDDLVTSGLEAINVSTTGGLRAKEGGLVFTPLLRTSPQTQRVDAAAFQSVASDPALLLQGFQPSGVSEVIAARLTGRPKSAFPQRAGEGHLAQSAADVQIVVVADSDLLSDRLWLTGDPAAGPMGLAPFANNGDLVYNLVENLTGRDELIALRARPSSQRPFERVDALRRGAEQQFLRTEQELQQQLADLEARLTALQSGEGEEGVVLTPEQQTELARFQDQKLAIRQQLRDVQQQLNADIESLGARLKLINIVGVPLLVALVAFLFATWRARRRQPR